MSGIDKHEPTHMSELLPPNAPKRGCLGDALRRDKRDGNIGLTKRTCILSICKLNAPYNGSTGLGRRQKDWGP